MSLANLSFEWDFYVSGGSGRRRLTVVSPEVEGYTTAQLKRASNGGKNMLYIAPLQSELDVTPLATNASEFSKMPKATCHNCQGTMPLHFLALHVDSCTDNKDCEVSCVLTSHLAFMMTLSNFFFFCITRTLTQMLSVSLCITHQLMTLTLSRPKWSL